MRINHQFGTGLSRKRYNYFKCLTYLIFIIMSNYVHGSLFFLYVTPFSLFQVNMGF